jgi:hypothetical protein
MVGNKTSFITKLVSSKSFTFILDSFDYAVTFLLRIKQRIPITFVFHAKLGSISNITLNKIKMVVLNSKLIGKILSSFTIKKIKLTIIFREIGKILFPITLKKIKLTAISRAIQKAVSPFTIKKVKIGFAGIYGTFYYLSTYDPQTLATMDSQTLSQLDFTIIP